MPPNNQVPNQQQPFSQGFDSQPNFPSQQGFSQQQNPMAQQQFPQTPQPNQPTAPQPPKNPNSSQNTLLLSEIRENMVIMTDGTFRSVIACQPINFDLMSPAEREAVEYTYQNFLNSLGHPIQILVRSQRVDIGPYLDKLISIRENNDNMLLGVLMDDYINFIDILSQEANIMDKSFFIVVPYFPQGELNTPLDQGKGFFNMLFSKGPPDIVKIDNQTYERAKAEIKNRVDSIMDGLFQIGIKSVQLNTKELGELYYNFYNPDTALREPLGNFSETASTYIRKAPASPVDTSGGLNG